MTDTSKQSNRARYDQGLRAEKYAKSRRRLEIAEEIAAWSATQIRRLAPPHPRILFVGGGVGYKDHQVAKLVPGATAIGIDIGFTPLQERATLFGLPLNVQGDMEILPFGTETIDAVCFFAALHHSAEPRRTLLEARRVLKPGGCLILTEPVSLRMLIKGEQFAPVGDNVNFKFSIRFLLREVAAAGFTVRRHDPSQITGRIMAAFGGLSENVLRAGLRIDRVIRWLPGMRLVGAVAYVAASRENC